MKPITLKDIEHELPMCDEMDAEPSTATKVTGYICCAVSIGLMALIVWVMV